DYYVTLGKNGIDKTREGDQKTPATSHPATPNLPRKNLTDFYGAGAFPINYPNEWDRRQGRNGHGIWLHGVPSDVYSRPPRASDGCIVLANPDLESLGQRLQIGLTPVIIADEIEWTDRAALEAERAGLAAALEQWRADWQSRDTERYLAHYSQRFASQGQDYAAWAAHKRKVNAAKAWIKLELYPAAAPKTVENFLQYVKDGHYNGTIFHRVIDGFMIQGGGFDKDFHQKKTRAPISNEAQSGVKAGLQNDTGTIAMARTADPNSATAQF